jgi:hypothetical protein
LPIRSLELIIFCPAAVADGESAAPTTEDPAARKLLLEVEALDNVAHFWFIFSSPV